MENNIIEVYEHSLYKISNRVLTLYFAISSSMFVLRPGYLQNIKLHRMMLEPPDACPKTGIFSINYNTYHNFDTNRVVVPRWVKLRNSATKLQFSVDKSFNENNLICSFLYLQSLKMWHQSSESTYTWKTRKTYTLLILTTTGHSLYLTQKPCTLTTLLPTFSQKPQSHQPSHIFWALSFVPAIHKHDKRF